MNKIYGTKTYHMVLAAVFLSLALLLPLLTGQIPIIGNTLCLIHIPILLCAFFCGPYYALAIGVIAPLLRSAIFGVPVMFPNAVAMCFELAAYGSICGFLYQRLPAKKSSIYISLIAAMVAGRFIWGGVMTLLTLSGDAASWGWIIFFSRAFVNAIPGIILQIVLIPLIVMAVQKRHLAKSQ